MGSSPLFGYSKSVGSVDECVFVVEVACMIGSSLVAMMVTVVTVVLSWTLVVAMVAFAMLVVDDGRVSRVGGETDLMGRGSYSALRKIVADDRRKLSLVTGKSRDKSRAGHGIHVCHVRRNITSASRAK